MRWTDWAIIGALLIVAVLQAVIYTRGGVTVWVFGTVLALVIQGIVSQLHISDLRRQRDMWMEMRR